MVLFIDAHREAYGVVPISEVLPIAPSTYYERKAREADPARLPARARRDEELRGRDPSGVDGELPGLRGAQGLEAASA